MEGGYLCGYRGGERGRSRKCIDVAFRDCVSHNQHLVCGFWGVLPCLVILTVCYFNERGMVKLRISYLFHTV